MSVALAPDPAAQLAAANARIAELETRLLGIEEEQAMREQVLEEALRQAANIIDLSSALSVVSSNAEMLRAVTQFSFAGGYAHAALLYFDLDVEGQPSALEIVEIRSAPGATGSAPRVGTRFQLTEFPITDLIVNTPQSVLLIGEVDSDPQLDDGARVILRHLGIASAIVIPLYAGGRFIGLVFVAFEQPHFWTDEEIALLQTVPNLVIPVADNVRLVASLEDNVNELNAALVFKDQFLAIMSHELRTPLNAILGYSSIAATTASAADDTFLTPEKLRHMMNRIVANSDRLLKLINSILDLSRINAGRLEIVNAPYELHQIARAWRDDFARRVKEKNLEFKFSLDETLPKHVIGDVERLTQIINNLLENAVKFTEAGEIDLKVGRAGDHLTIQVRDTGIGISPTWHHLIFEEFRRVEMDSVRRTSGAGLGLSIVQRLCKLMGGSVGVESELGKGSTFTITLPIVEAASEPEPAPPAEPTP
ncbi:MAG: HAMP domain-containing histidine kinase [Anaerolineae bacterium]|nr:HAMP domain-containing histidine kinase [Anaerolineae bacterium]NUQ05541.1 HAMP domain-containing histidine kinase [Anaerolineae bacterium]